MNGTNDGKLQRVLDMIRKLRAHNGAGRTTEEQGVFAAKVKQLMDEYSISEAMLSGAQYEARHAIGRVTFDASGLRLTKYEINTFLPQLACVVATAHHCRIVMVANAAKVHIIGRDVDRAIAGYMLETLFLSALRLADQARKKTVLHRPRTFRQDFEHGYVVTIAERYREQRETTEDQAKNDGQIEGLMIVRHSLVRICEWLTTQDEIPIDGTGAASSRPDDLDAAVAGVEAAMDQSLATNGIATSATGQRSVAAGTQRLLSAGRAQ